MDFLKSKQRSLLSNLSFVVEPAITEEDNLMICKVPSMDEVKNAIFSIPIIVTQDQIVKVDVLDAASECFRGKRFPLLYSTSSLVLIPKVDHPNSFDKF